MRRLATTLTALVFVAAALACYPLAVSAQTSDNQKDQQAVAAKQLQTDSDLNALAATQQQLEGALSLLQANVAIQQRRLNAAQHVVDTDQHKIDVAQAGIRSNTARLKKLRSQMASVAIESYILPGDAGLAFLLDSKTAADDLNRGALLKVRSDQIEDLTHQIEHTESNLEHQRALATAARSQARAKRATVEAQLTAVRTAEDQQQKLADGVQQRINLELASAIQLAQQNRLLSIEVALDQAALEARLANLADSLPPGAVPYGANGAETAPLAGAGTTDPQGSGVDLQLCNVDNITVNCLISSNVAAMLAAAAADGLTLTGSGYRSSAEQIALREAHCGTSEYAIYDEPADDCTPPTAQPGESMHEVGLAIDFEDCDSHSTAAWQWLNANAASFGFYNLAAEPWHWSINGN